MSHVDAVMRALVYRGGSRFKRAWFMFTATWAYSRAHGMTIREAFPGAWENAVGVFSARPSIAPPHPEAVRNALKYMDAYLDAIDASGKRTTHSKHTRILVNALRAAKSAKQNEQPQVTESK